MLLTAVRSMSLEEALVLCVVILSLMMFTLIWLATHRGDLPPQEMALTRRKPEEITTDLLLANVETKNILWRSVTDARFRDLLLLRRQRAIDQYELRADTAQMLLDCPERVLRESIEKLADATASTMPSGQSDSSRSERKRRRRGKTSDGENVTGALTPTPSDSAPTSDDEADH